MNITSYTREQVQNFSDERKASIAYGNYVKPEEKFDAALVLGGPYHLMESRAKAAAELYHAGQTEFFITTGRVCRDSKCGAETQAQILADYMVEFGVPREKIILENCASTTHENMTFSKPLLKEYLGEKKLHLAIVTSYFHVVRSVKLAYAYIPEHEHVGVRAEYPLDAPDTFFQSDYFKECVTKECCFMWDYATDGLVPDFSIL